MKTRVSWVVLLILIGRLAVPVAAQQTGTVSGRDYEQPLR